MNNVRISKQGFTRIAVIAISLLIILGMALSLAQPMAIPVDTLKQGSSGEQVKALQQELKNQGFYSGSVDGVYGNGTVTAVKSMQKAYGMTVDGIAGSKTLEALGISNSGSGSNGGSSGASVSGYSDADVYLLAKTIHAEARGEPYIGQVAVGAVILNRVKSSEFPNTITEVVYQPWAFTAVNDGQINLEPNESSMRAAKDALGGWDPTYGCEYYYNPVTATSKWIFTTDKKMQIGKHVFATK